ncbi:SDR family oxidoreductase [Gorillibacterium sp. sgz500922]|uniref:SDR family oxidoreductase n=1 Tax=Gorillibacterium sp. sgz500922 TaxID=3446694 RepID=UPI003F6734DB
MHDKVAVVTGANSGMGFATTVELARRGARVIMACRSRERGQKALEEAVRQSGSNAIELFLCDLGDLASVRFFVDTLTAAHPVVDLLINNAGVVTLSRETTKDGFESMLGINHLGHFLLTRLLLDSMKKAPAARIVNVSSGAHKIGRIDFDNPFLTRGFNVVRGYAQSKLANILFTKELARRLAGTGVTVNALHPGAVGTNIGIDRRTGFGKRVLALLRPFFLTPAQGAETALYLATCDEIAGVSGEYFYRKLESPVSKRASDRKLAARLWEWSEQQVGL